MDGQSTAYWQTPRMWDNATVVIIGGGPSLQAMPWDALRQTLLTSGARTIACNDAYLLNWPDMVVFGDWEWYKIHRNVYAWQAFQGLKVGCCFEALGEPGLFALERRDLKWQTQPGRIGWFGNTGVSAINLAVNLGAKKVVLLGFDMKHDKAGNSNWYDKLKDKTIHPASYNRFKLLADRLPQSIGVDVFNANPDSAWDRFPRMTWQEALQHG